MHWPTILVSSCKVQTFPRRWLTSLQTRLIKIGARGSTSRPRHHVPACRGRGQRQSLSPHFQRDPPAALTTSSRMRISAPKPERKRLDRAVQICAYQTKSRVDSTLATENQAQLARHMPRHWYGVPERLDSCAKLLKNHRVRVIRGQCTSSNWRCGSFGNSC